ncbi:MAG: hypothetical protein RR318_03035, partial [Alistipes sp.]
IPDPVIPDPPKPEYEGTLFKAIDCVYHGEKEGIGNYGLVLRNGSTFDAVTGQFSGAGEFIFISLNTATPAHPTDMPPVGTYTGMAAGAAAAAQTFYTASFEQKSYTGTISAANVAATKDIASGSFTIAVKDNVYTIIGTFKTADGKDFKCKYVGAAPVVTDLSKPAFTGTVYQTLKCAYYGAQEETGYVNYILALSNKSVFDPMMGTFSGAGEFISLSLNTNKPANFTDLPPAGTYTGMVTGAAPKPFTFYTASSWLKSSAGTISADNIATSQNIGSGEFTITVKGETYTIIGTFKTTDGDDISCKYEGVIPTVIDQSYHEPEPAQPFDGTFKHGFINYLGDYYKGGTGTIILNLVDMDMDGVQMTPPGHRLQLCVNTTLFTTPDILLPAGSYTAAPEKQFNKQFTFTAGYMDDNGEPAGSMWLDVDSGGGEGGLFVMDGTMSVSAKQGDNQTIHLELTLEDGSKMEGDFTGKLELFDETCLSLLKADLDVKDLTKGHMTYYGNTYSETLASWEVILASDGIDLTDKNNMSGTGNWFVINFNVAASEPITALPAGTYNVAISDWTQFAPLTYIEGYYSTLTQSCRGTWYADGENFIAPLITGPITVAVKDGVYDITLALQDDYPYGSGAHNVTATYHGSLTYSNEDIHAGSGAHIQNKLAKAPLSTFNKNVKMRLHR